MPRALNFEETADRDEQAIINLLHRPQHQQPSRRFLRSSASKIWLDALAVPATRVVAAGARADVVVEESEQLNKLVRDVLLLVEATLSLQEAKKCQMVGLTLEMKED